MEPLNRRIAILWLVLGVSIWGGLAFAPEAGVKLPEPPINLLFFGGLVCSGFGAYPLALRLVRRTKARLCDLETAPPLQRRPESLGAGLGWTGVLLVIAAGLFLLTTPPTKYLGRGTETQGGLPGRSVEVFGIDWEAVPTWVWGALLAGVQLIWLGGDLAKQLRTTIPSAAYLRTAPRTPHLDVSGAANKWAAMSVLRCTAADFEGETMREVPMRIGMTRQADLGHRRPGSDFSEDPVAEPVAAQQRMHPTAAELTRRCRG